MLEPGADINSHDAEQHTPYSVAIAFGHTSSRDILLFKAVCDEMNGMVNAAKLVADSSKVAEMKAVR